MPKNRKTVLRKKHNRSTYSQKKATLLNTIKIFTSRIFHKAPTKTNKIYAQISSNIKQKKKAKYPRLEKFGLITTLIYCSLLFWDISSEEKIIVSISATPLFPVMAIIFITAVFYTVHKIDPILTLFVSNDRSMEDLRIMLGSTIIIIGFFWFVFSAMSMWGR